VTVVDPLASAGCAVVDGTFDAVGAVRVSIGRA
jgi:hypothetical protein